MKALLLFILSLSTSPILFAQYSCATAVNMTNGFSTGIISTPGNSPSTENWISSATIVGGSSSGAFTAPDVYMFKYTTGATAGEAFYFTIECDYSVDGEHSIGVWTGCSGSSLTSCKTSTYEFENVLGVCAQNLLANTTYYIGIGKEWVFSAADRKLKFQVLDFTVESSSSIPSDECTTAALINIADPYTGSTRCNYTASAGSPSGCGSIENDSWVKFTAGSSNVEIDYAISDCTRGNGVQLSVYSGSCGSLTQVSGSCINYASNNATGTWIFTGLTSGSTYYIRTDGYAGDLCTYSFIPISGIVVLSIDVVNFSVSALDNGYNRITWQTLSEINSDFIVVEKSLNGHDFTAINSLKAAGNSSETKNYYFLDHMNSSRLSYYRLKLMDADGTFRYSEIQSINNDFAEGLTIYPNPTKNGQVKLTVKPSDGIQRVELYNRIGNRINNWDIDNKTSIDLDLSEHPSGLYFVKAVGTNSIFIKQVVIDN